MKIAMLIALALALLGLVVVVYRARAQGAPNDPVDRARADIEAHGWHLVMVAGDGAPGVLYTVGLWESYNHPEIVLFAPSDDPRGMAQRLAAVAKQVAEGATFESGTSVESAFGAHPGAVRDVQPQWVPSFLEIGGAVRESFDFPAVQLFWPDRDGRFPWQSGFTAGLFVQPILYERHAVLANVGRKVARRALDDPHAFETALDELLLQPSDIGDGDILDAWRWRIGPDVEPMAVTLFGDVFVTAPDGHIHWLDTGSNLYETVAADRDAWRQLVSRNLPVFLHASTLLHLRSLDWAPDEGQVYSWIRPPILGGDDTVDNVDRVSAAVHLSNSGRTAKSARGPGAL
ncbi:MAG: DUF4262 domain-containing protein [Acidobacteriota bacterium]